MLILLIILSSQKNFYSLTQIYNLERNLILDVKKGKKLKLIHIYNVKQVVLTKGKIFWKIFKCRKHDEFSKSFFVLVENTQKNKLWQVNTNF